MASELRRGVELAGFRIESLLARGAMGVVYRAIDLTLEREVALKFIAPELASQQAFRERFLREARIVASLGHSHVLPVYQVGEVEGEIFLAMQLVNGPSLAELLRTEVRLKPDRAALIVSQIGDALDAAHVAGVVHRDVKPANVLLAGSGSHAFLCDFGLSRRTSSGTLTQDGSFLGTPAYASPEQIRGEALDARSDVYALGCVLYECLTGNQPFGREQDLALMWAHMHDAAPKPSEHDPSLVHFDWACARALSKEPDDRFPSAGDLGRAAVAAAGGVRTRAAERSVASGEAAAIAVGRRRRMRRRTRNLVLGLTFAVAAGLFVAIGSLATGTLGGDQAPKNAAGRIVGAPVAVPYNPNFIAAGEGRVWGLATSGNTLVRFDTGSEQVDVFSAGVDLGGREYADIAVGPNAVWIAHAVTDVGGVDHVDPETGEAVQHVPFELAAAVAAEGEAVWAVAPGDADEPGKLVHIDAVRDRITGRPVSVGHDPAAVAIGDSAVWVANRGDDSVWRINPKTGVVKAKITVGDEPAALTVTDHGVWVANFGDRTLMRIDPAANRVLGAPVSLGKEIHDLVGSDESLWVSAADGTVTRLDAATGAIVGSPLSPAGAALALAVDGNSVWVGSSSDQTLTRIEERKQ